MMMDDFDDDPWSRQEKPQFPEQEKEQQQQEQQQQQRVNPLQPSDTGSRTVEETAWDADDDDDNDGNDNFVEATSKLSLSMLEQEQEQLELELEQDQDQEEAHPGRAVASGSTRHSLDNNDAAADIWDGPLAESPLGTASSDAIAGPSSSNQLEDDFGDFGDDMGNAGGEGTNEDDDDDDFGAFDEADQADFSFGDEAEAEADAPQPPSLAPAPTPPIQSGLPPPPNIAAALTSAPPGTSSLDVLTSIVSGYFAQVYPDICGPQAQAPMTNANANAMDMSERDTVGMSAKDIIIPKSDTKMRQAYEELVEKEWKYKPWDWKRSATRLAAMRELGLPVNLDDVGALVRRDGGGHPPGSSQCQVFQTLTPLYWSRRSSPTRQRGPWLL